MAKTKTSRYEPPCTVTPLIERKIGEICEIMGRISSLADAGQNLLLRRINRIRTIHGSLAIEGNPLSEEQVTAILEGKRVIAPPREIQEVRNAIKAYDMLERWHPTWEADLLDAHGILMSGLVDFPGHYRTGGVGVLGQEGVIHVAPPASRVPGLMRDLLNWLATNQRHPLVASSIFHYEFEFIHPFEDGNGRIGRLWQTLILSRWNATFILAPVESLVHAHQQEYYAALGKSTDESDSASFVEFMLSVILEVLGNMQGGENFTGQVEGQVTEQVGKLLTCLENTPQSRREMMKKLGLKGRDNFEKRYLRLALNLGLIELTIPEKPNSRLQKYRATRRGQKLLGSMNADE